MFLTSYSDQETLQEISKIDPAAFLVKPFKPEDLVSSVFLILKKHQKESDETIPYQLKQVIEYIDENIEQRINIKTLAQLTRWEVTHFSRLFKKHFHYTPHQYILNVKIERAKKQLIDSCDSLQDLAQDLGFGAYSNFYNAFKKMTNSTPEKFRLNHQKLK